LQPHWKHVRAAADHPALWFSLAFALLAYAAPPLSDHPDTVRDLLQARDCVDGGHCTAGGAQASFGQLRSGAAWPATLAALRWVGAPTQAVHVLVLAADSAAVAVLAALSGAWPAALLATALLIATREHLIWSPALLPLVAALAAAQWQRSRRNQQVRSWAALGLLLGLQADLHPLGGLYAFAAMLVLPWTAAQPLRATLAGSAAALCTAVALAPELQLANLRAVHLQGGWLLVSGAILLLGSGVAAWWHAAKSQLIQGESCPRPFASPWPLAASVALGAGAVLLAAALGVGPLHPRYFLAALPAMCMALGVGLAWLPRSIAPVVAAATAMAMGPASIGIGHPWSVVLATSSDLGQHRQGWPTHLYRVQGPGCRRLAAAVQLELPAVASPSAESQYLAWQFNDLEDATVPPGPGWRPTAPWQNGPRRVRTWLRTTRPWLQVYAGRGCLISDGQRQCQAMQPGILPSGFAALPQASIPWHLRTFPSAITLTPANFASQTTFELPLAIPLPGQRQIALQQLPERRCPWRIEAVHSSSAGISSVLAADRQSAGVVAKAPGQATLLVSRSWGPGCDDSTEWEFGPPCLLETEVQP
jgi:hypothetical protein